MTTKTQLDNLVKIKKGDLSNEELKKRQSNGGKRSVEVRKEKKLIKEELLKRMNEKDWDEMMSNAIERAKGTDKGFETFRDSIGQKPAQEVNLTSDAEELEFTFKYSK